MPTTAQARTATIQRRNLSLPGSWDTTPEAALADKGPKHTCFDAQFLGAGRRAVERALRQDRKR
jgi:hypothetical protein